MSDELEEQSGGGEELPEPPDVSGGAPGGQPDGQQPPAEPPEKPDDLRLAMTELAGHVKSLARPAEPPPKQPTPEEISEMWAIYNPEKQNKDFFRKFFRLADDSTPEQLEEAKQLFTEMHSGLMRQAMQGARNFIAMELDKLQKEFGPVKEYVETARREATRDRFHEAYPGLSESKFSKIVEATARSLNDKTFETEDAYFKELAEGSAAAIKEILPEFDLGKAPEPKQPGKTPKLPRSSVGGGGGAGKGRHEALQPTGSKNDIDSLEVETATA